MRPIDADALYERAYQLNLDYIVSDVELRMVKTLLDHAPTIEERKKGQWRYYDGMCSCSVCNSHMDDISPFCPMCGADMRG